MVIKFIQKKKYPGIAKKIMKRKNEDFLDVRLSCKIIVVMTLGMSMTLTWEQTGQWNKIDYQELDLRVYENLRRIRFN